MILHYSPQETGEIAKYELPNMPLKIGKKGKTKIPYTSRNQKTKHPIMLHFAF